MRFDDREMLYKRARIALHHGRLADAARMFDALVRDCETDGRFLSYRGLLTGLLDRRVPEGVATCRRAITLASCEPDTYLSLVRLYASTGQSGNAVNTLRSAIRRGVRSRAVLGEIERLSPRRKPPIVYLHRDHILNRLLGKLRARSTRMLCDPQRAFSTGGSRTGALAHRS